MSRGAVVSSGLTSDDIVQGYTTPFEEALDSLKSFTGGGHRAVESLGALYAMVLDTVSATFRELLHGRFAWREFVDQSWFLASVSVLPAILIAVPFGLVIVLEVGGLAGQIGAASFVGAVDAIGTVREASPIVTALLLAGAGGSAICSELGARTIRDEISAMEVMGINPVHRLVLPRLLAATVVAVLLDAVVSVAGIAGGLFFGMHSVHVTQSSFFSSFDELAQLADLGIALFKAAVFGFLAAMVACYKGLHAKGGPKGVGDAVNQAVVVTFVLAFFVNFVMTIFYFNFIPQKSL
jgi:phospholipid/cholesterol/gamma-HCH transport system permease protein